MMHPPPSEQPKAQLFHRDSHGYHPVSKIDLNSVQDLYIRNGAEGYQSLEVFNEIKSLWNSKLKAMNELISTLNREQRYEYFFENGISGVLPTNLEKYIVKTAKETNDILIPIIWSGNIIDQAIYEPRLQGLGVSKAKWEGEILPHLVTQFPAIKSNRAAFINLQTLLYFLCLCCYLPNLRNYSQDPEVERECVDCNWSDSNAKNYKYEISQANTIRKIVALRQLMQFPPSIKIVFESFTMSHSIVPLRVLKKVFEKKFPSFPIEYFGKSIMYLPILRISSPQLPPPIDPLLWIITSTKINGAILQQQDMVQEAIPFASPFLELARSRTQTAEENQESPSVDIAEIMYSHLHLISLEEAELIKAAHITKTILKFMDKNALQEIGITSHITQAKILAFASTLH